jgi:arylsulfatase
MNPLWSLRLPRPFKMQQDPFERVDESSITYWDLVVDHVSGIYAAQVLTAQQIQSFVEFPPHQKPASFNLDSLLEKVQQATDGSLH